jgi:hypothetical protein
VKLKTAQLAPVRAKMLQLQQYTCPLCGGSMKGGQKKPALDHSHVTGYVRDVLCVNCNQFEGKTYNGALRSKGKLTPEQWVRNLLAYWDRHQTPQHGGLIHPTHKTADEKRLATNAKARKKRAAHKESTT